MTIDVKIVRLARAADLPIPARQTPLSAGFDVAAAVESPVTLQPMQIALIPAGFSMEIPEGYEAQIRPRSGLSLKHGITCVNAVGTIDADFRGELRVPMINLGSAPFTIERGMRIAQMIIAKLPEVRLVEVNALSDTSRGSGGFGHTGH
jgi:dUTP pyrophosphatase